MAFTRRADSPVAGDDRGLPHPFPREHSTIDALRRALQMEGVRQEAIAAEIAEQRELEDEVRRELGLFREGPSRNPARFQRHGRDTSPEQDDELRSGKAMPMQQTGASSVVRRSVKGRLEEWYQPPRHNTTEDEDGASFSVLYKEAYMYDIISD
ncbi:hypothetical protein GUJ93_ZPchr0010g10419 [Zizania palustris]|uniref:Uncharacterized protein n=1 Tax=Zizania palustris TaxID=103762 RepID=A0A8J6BLL5_ZIZPA|nr:hypothetical protein GUJ93_ZPchr0010g10419 [Zizania palustris]